MKQPLFSIRFLFLCVITLAAASGKAQYYYKDIVVTAQSQEKLKSLKANKVGRIALHSLERDGEPTPGFVCTQTCSADYKTMTTYTTTSSIPPSTLVAFYDKSGRLMKTSDSSERYVSTTTYEYDASGQILAVRNVATETDNHLQNSEDHLWAYRNGIPSSMLKIKNGTDTSFVAFKTEAGNVTAEQATHGKEKMPEVYYYYDSVRLLTDIVRYNVKARRLLPDYMFSYENGRLVSMIFVPSGTGDYENWRYEYDLKNLKVRDVCRNRKKETIAMVNYSYSFQ